MPERMKVLITVKTYPLPSEGYQELVCTAGVLEDGSHVRLYPIDYRYRPYWQWFKKYHRMMIEDWEIGQLYRTMRDKFGEERVAIEKVKDKFLSQMCAPDVDTHFFVGTVLKFGTCESGHGNRWPEGLW